MMEIITYSLRKDRATSAQYYREVAGFTDEVLDEAEIRLDPLVKSFKVHVEQTGCDLLRSRQEYAFDLLTLGILWRVYARRVPAVPELPRRLLAGLARLRKQGGALKAGADFLRGLLATLLLSPAKKRSKATPNPSPAHLSRLIDWLKTTDNFNQEAKRMGIWRDFLAERTPSEAANAMQAILGFGAWFERRSQAVLGAYTPNVNRFLAQTHPGYRWREDFIFCGRQRVEYHLNMVGTELLNRAFRSAFLGTARKIVIVPPCMRAKAESQCKAHQTSMGARCAGCTAGCRVNQLTRLGDKHGFEVLIMPDELSVFSDSRPGIAGESKPGVVGVSCVLTNAPGGWETCDLGVPAQGLLLDYCGCSFHWHKQGIPTDINFNQLLRILGESKVRQG